MSEPVRFQSDRHALMTGALLAQLTAAGIHVHPAEDGAGNLLPQLLIHLGNAGGAFRWPEDAAVRIVVPPPPEPPDPPERFTGGDDARTG